MARKVNITDTEASFVDDIVNGIELLEAYRRNYSNNYNDAKARYAAKQILKREAVQDLLRQVIMDRSEGVSLDEAFVIDNLKKIVLGREGTTQAVRALELLGKKLGMWIDRQEIEEVTTHRQIADEVFERQMAKERGETMAPLEAKEDKKEAEILEFVIKSGTDD